MCLSISTEKNNANVFLSSLFTKWPRLRISLPAKRTAKKTLIRTRQSSRLEPKKQIYDL